MWVSSFDSVSSAAALLPVPPPPLPLAPPPLPPLVLSAFLTPSAWVEPVLGVGGHHSNNPKLGHPETAEIHSTNCHRYPLSWREGPPEGTGSGWAEGTGLPEVGGCRLGWGPCKGAEVGQKARDTQAHGNEQKPDVVQDCTEQVALGRRSIVAEEDAHARARARSN